ncbi:MAG TPA: CGNR zinc finger domain-containing protein [Actinomycetospora sp.]|jgi:predicted RNA-binding Zn ribbon-like protein|uniref:CGNR zinc finger domain-containing protein n=1 Tax=Actinomycetospora sp. TaxID=1872135 RepID=UPI002F3E35F9
MTTQGAAHGESWPVELMNTVRAGRQGVQDTLDDPEQAAAWLERAGLGLGGAVLGPMGPPGPLDIDVLQRLRTLRDALRRLAAEATADDRTTWTSPVGHVDEAVAVVNAAAAAAPTWAALDRDADGGLVRVARSAASPALAVVGMLAERAVDLFTDPEGLRACRAPGCVLYFVKAHPRQEWCSTGCGNRARVARHYRRHHHGDQFE